MRERWGEFKGRLDCVYPRIGNDRGQVLIMSFPLAR